MNIFFRFIFFVVCLFAYSDLCFSKDCADKFDPLISFDRVKFSRAFNEVRRAGDNDCIDDLLSLYKKKGYLKVEGDVFFVKLSVANFILQKYRNGIFKNKASGKA